MNKWKIKTISQAMSVSKETILSNIKIKDMVNGYTRISEISSAQDNSSCLTI